MQVWKKMALSAATVALAGGTLAAIGVVGTPAIASAQAAYGSYVGVGASFGLTEGGPNEKRQVAAVIAGRYKFLEAPLSIRAQTLLFSGTTAIIPVISYDIPVSWQTDAYIGAGYSFSSGDNPSPVGNKNAIVIQPGIDYCFPASNLVLFGNAIFAFDAYRQGGGTAVSVQGGLGFRF